MSVLEARKSDLSLALRLADIADAISMGRFRSAKLDSERKADGSIVTAADLEIETALRQELQRSRPEDAVWGEEFGGSLYGSRVWTLDPIDGTGSFAEGSAEWATLISLVEEGVPVVGVVSRPADNQRWWAAQGLGAFSDGRRIRVTKTRRLAEAVVGEDFRISIGWKLTTNPLLNLARVCAAVHPSRFGLAFLQVAEGMVDVALLWYSGTGPDLYSSLCILAEAGGRHSNLEGASDVYSEVQLVSNGLVHEEALKLVNDCIASGLADPSVRPTEDIPAIQEARRLQPDGITPVEV